MVVGWVPLSCLDLPLLSLCSCLLPSIAGEHFEGPTRALGPHGGGSGSIPIQGIFTYTLFNHGRFGLGHVGHIQGLPLVGLVLVQPGSLGLGLDPLRVQNQLFELHLGIQGSGWFRVYLW